MFFRISNAGTFSNMESMDSIMLRSITAIIMNSTACHNLYFCFFTNIEIIINKILYATFSKNYRNMNTLPFCMWCHNNINPRLILLCDYFYILRRMTFYPLTIFSKIKCTAWHKTTNIGNCL